MTDRHKEHRASIIQRMSVDQHKRYEKGVEKYGTYLPDMSLPELLENALEETYDTAEPQVSHFSLAPAATNCEW